ncbi:MAG: glycosyl hydrolase [Acidimicrobiales bacterium]
MTCLVGATMATAGTVLSRRDLGTSFQPTYVAQTTTSTSTLPVPAGGSRPHNPVVPAVTTTTVPTSGGSAPSARPSGLVQAADSKAACITDEPGPTLTKAERNTGYLYNCIETFTDVDKTWAEWVNPWIAESPGAPFQTWVADDPTHHQLIDTQNLIPDDEASDPNWTAACAAGDFNTYAEEFAAKMVGAGFGYAIIRLGHEMNGDWENDSLGTTVASWKLWGQCFAQEVAAMRAVHGAHFLFDWSINAGYRDIPLADFYPGDAYVDIVGISFYDQSGYPLPAVGSPDRWQALASEPMGLDEVYSFAAQHHKPLGIPEWGTVTTQGDDANYVVHMADFIDGHDIAYEAWFDAGDLKIYPLNPAEDPRSLAAYKQTVLKGR